jgi:hypothetical protein
LTFLIDDNLHTDHGMTAMPNSLQLEAICLASF